jgi:hypothetical protein
MKYRNAKYINDSGWVECEINHPEFGWIPYGLNPADTDMTVNNDDLLAAMAVSGDVAAYVPPTQAELDAALAAELRLQRDGLLTDVDVIAGNALRWVDLSADKQAAWGIYRQALLGVPQQAGFPNDVTWPTKP